MPNLAAVYQELVSTAKAGSLIESLSTSPLWLLPLRRHPLGFLVAKADDHAGTCLRLHVWPHADALGQVGYEVHDHMFDLESYIVRGSVRQMRYRAVEDPAGDLRAYSVAYDAGSSRLIPTAKTLHIEAVGEEIIRRGESYQLSAGVLHQLSALEDWTVTLVLTRDRLGAPTTIGPLNGEPEMAAPRHIVRIDDDLPGTVQALRHILK